MSGATPAVHHEAPRRTRQLGDSLVGACEPANGLSSRHRPDDEERLFAPGDGVGHQLFRGVV